MDGFWRLTQHLGKQKQRVETCFGVEGVKRAYKRREKFLLEHQFHDGVRRWRTRFPKTSQRICFQRTCCHCSRRWFSSICFPFWTTICMEFSSCKVQEWKSLAKKKLSWYFLEFRRNTLLRIRGNASQYSARCYKSTRKRIRKTKMASEISIERTQHRRPGVSIAAKTLRLLTMW